MIIGVVGWVLFFIIVLIVLAIIAVRSSSIKGALDMSTVNAARAAAKQRGWRQTSPPQFSPSIPTSVDAGKLHALGKAAMGKKELEKVDIDVKTRKRGKKRRADGPKGIVDVLNCPPLSHFHYELVVGNGIGERRSKMRSLLSSGHGKCGG